MKVTWGALPVAVLASSMLLACGKDEGATRLGDPPKSPNPPSNEAGADAGNGSDAGDGGQRCTTSMPFRIESVSRLGGGINTEDIQWGASLTSDEKTIAFTRNDDPGGWDLQLYMATRASQTGDFGPPSRIDLACSLPCMNYNAQLSASGDSMVFASTRNGGVGQIFQAQRVGNDLTNVTPIYSDPAGSNAPFLTSGGELFFTIGDASPAIFRSLKASDGSFPSGERIQALASVSGPSDTGPVLSRDGLTMYFSSTYPYVQGYDAGDATQGNWHIFVMERATVNDSFGVPMPVNGLRGVDGSVAELANWLSDDGCRLYFNTALGGHANIYVASKL